MKVGMDRLHGWISEFDWKAAVGEVILIMISILAALGVNDWWDRRKDAAIERTYLEQLALDIDANAGTLEMVITRHEEAIDAATRLALAFDASGALPSCDALCDRLASALTWAPLTLRTGTYSALLTTGELRLIRNRSLRAEIVQYGGLVDAVMRQSNQTETESWSTALPFRRRVEFFWRLFLPRDPSAPPPSASCNFEPFRHDPEIREALFSTHLLHLNRLEAVKELAAANDTLRSHIKAEPSTAP